MEIRQRLPGFFPGHMEILADCGNLLAQGYVPLATEMARSSSFRPTGIFRVA